MFIESGQTRIQLFSQHRARLLAGAQEVNQDYQWGPKAQAPCCNANGWDLVLEKDRLTEWPCSIHFLVNQSYDHVLLLLPHAINKGKTEKTPHVALQFVLDRTLASVQIAIFLCQLAEFCGGVHGLALDEVGKAEETLFGRATLVTLRV